MENASAGTLSPGENHDWLDAATAVLKGVWSAARAFHGALHKQPARRKADPRPEATERPAAAGSPSWLDKGELPESYGRTKVVAMVVSPYMAHVYWDLGKEDSELTDPASLRFHEAGGAGSFDVNVNLATRNWYVHLWSPEKRYYVELGVGRGGEFSKLARSNTIETPRAWPVAEVREQFTRVPAPVPTAEPKPVPPGEPKVWSEPESGDGPKIRTTERVNASLPQTGAGAPSAGWQAAQAERPPVSTDPIAESVPPPSAQAPEPMRSTTGADRPEANPASPARAFPLGATEILRKRLAEFYAFRRWRPRQGAPTEPEEVEASMAVLLDPTGESVAADLTGRIESQFTPGFSSVLLAATKKPAE